MLDSKPVSCLPGSGSSIKKVSSLRVLASENSPVAYHYLQLPIINSFSMSLNDENVIVSMCSNSTGVVACINLH